MQALIFAPLFIKKKWKTRLAETKKHPALRAPSDENRSRLSKRGELQIVEITT